MYEELRSLFLNAMDTSIPKTKPYCGPGKTGQNAWWTEECRTAVKLKRKAKDKYDHFRSEQNHALMKLMEEKCDEVINEAKRNYFEQMSSKVSDYREAERPLVYEGKKFEGQHEKAELFAEIFAAASQTNKLPPEQIQFRTKWENENILSDPEPDPSQK